MILAPAASLAEAELCWSQLVAALRQLAQLKGGKIYDKSCLSDVKSSHGLVHTCGDELDSSRIGP